ncbi:hypothetical protein [Mycoplasma sp. 3398]
MEKQAVVLLIVIYTMLAIILIIDLIFIIRHFKNKKRSEMQNEESEINKVDLNTEIKKISRFIPNTKYIKEGKYRPEKFDSFISGALIINSYGLFVIKNIKDNAMLVEGDYNNREWFLTTPKAKYCINNLFWDLNKNIDNLLPLLPNNLPVIGILIFEDIDKIDINNYPGYLGFSKLKDLSSFMNDAKRQLKPIITPENVEKIVELLNNKRFEF